MVITAKRRALVERMIKGGHTGASLARTTGISKGYVCQILNGKRKILPPTAKKICGALECDFDDIFEIQGVSGE